MLISGFANVVYNINQVSLRQAITPERMQGRMNATMRFLVWGTIPIGTIIGGLLGTAIGLRETILLGGVLSSLPFVFVLFSPVRGIQKMPEPADEDTADMHARSCRARPKKASSPRSTSRWPGPKTTEVRAAASADDPLPAIRGGRATPGRASGCGCRAPRRPRSLARSPRRRGAARPCRVGGEHALELLGRARGAVGDDDHARVLRVADAHAAAVVDTTPRWRR